MALIKCSECHHEVSDRAASCPKCGAPIANAVATGTSTVTTESTSKRMKKHQLIGVALLISGILTTCIGQRAPTVEKMTSSDMTFAAIGLLLFLAGITWYIVARIRSWWHHG